MLIARNKTSIKHFNIKNLDPRFLQWILCVSNLHTSLWNSYHRDKNELQVNNSC